jgi:hypothetical protein
MTVQGRDAFLLFDSGNKAGWIVAATRSNGSSNLWAQSSAQVLYG